MRSLFFIYTAIAIFGASCFIWGFQEGKQTQLPQPPPEIQNIELNMPWVKVFDWPEELGKLMPDHDYRIKADMIFERHGKDTLAIGFRMGGQ